MILKKTTLIFSILLLTTSLHAKVEEKSINYEKCELEYSSCIQYCDSKEDATEECYETCVIKEVRCEEKEELPISHEEYDNKLINDFLEKRTYAHNEIDSQNDLYEHNTFVLV